MFKLFAKRTSLPRCPKCNAPMLREIRWINTGAIYVDACTNTECNHITPAPKTTYGFPIKAF